MSRWQSRRQERIFVVIGGGCINDVANVHFNGMIFSWRLEAMHSTDGECECFRVSGNAAIGHSGCAVHVKTCTQVVKFVRCDESR